MPSLRLQRVRELLKREIGEVIRREFQVSDAGLITVNDVDVAGDLHSAVVFISVLGSANSKNEEWLCWSAIANAFRVWWGGPWS